MLISYAIFVTAAALVFLYKYDVWKSQALAEESDRIRVQDELDKLNTEYQFLKDAMIALHQKPYYIVLQEEQVERIAQVVSARLKEPDPWLN